MLMRHGVSKMKGWMLPYDMMHAIGVCFMGLRIIMHMIWLNAWVNYTVLSIGAVLIATQFLRNQWKAEQQRNMTISLSGDRQRVRIETTATSRDFFNSMGQRRGDGGDGAGQGGQVKWQAIIPISRITWIESPAEHVRIIHLDDWSRIAGTVSPSHEVMIFRDLENALK